MQALIFEKLTEPAVEPVAWYDGNKFYATESAAYMACADIKNLRPVCTPQPADVSLLTDDVINAEAAKHQLSTTEERHWYGDDYTVSINNIKGANDFARAIEQLVRKKSGLK